tara:strand:+ start:286 stop:1065 length:780 start_codon:yes stop_codon:yes gene_type:complete
MGCGLAYFIIFLLIKIIVAGLYWKGIIPDFFNILGDEFTECQDSLSSCVTENCPGSSVNPENLEDCNYKLKECNAMLCFGESESFANTCPPTTESMDKSERVAELNTIYNCLADPKTRGVDGLTCFDGELQSIAEWVMCSMFGSGAGGVCGDEPANLEPDRSEIKLILSWWFYWYKNKDKDCNISCDDCLPTFKYGQLTDTEIIENIDSLRCCLDEKLAAADSKEDEFVNCINANPLGESMNALIESWYLSWRRASNCN